MTPFLNIVDSTAQEEGDGNDTQYYDHGTVKKLLKIMSKIEYGDCKKQEKSMNALYENAIIVAKANKGIRGTAKAWTKQFTRIKQDYTVFAMKISASGRSAREDDLFDKPEFFEEINELENEKDRDDPSAQMDSTKHSNASSSPGRFRSSMNTRLEAFMVKTEEQNELIIKKFQSST